MSLFANLSFQRALSRSVRPRRSYWGGEIPLGSASCHFHTYATDRLLSQTREKDEKRRLSGLPTATISGVAHYHSSAPTERAVAIILGFGALSAAAFGAASAVRAYNEWQATLPEEPPVEEIKEEASESQQASQQESQQADSKDEEKQDSKTKEKSENVFAKWFGVDVGTNYYEGGFEETMTRREAALILGVRESSSVARIKEAHRKLLILNHPDTGGSTYISGKINEAKELLLKGRRDK